MSRPKENNNKIGARCLSDIEAELILPTYERIYYQIDQFRKEKEAIGREKQQRVNSQDENQSSRNQDITQKTNNIGIIGVRGAGKTSVLKTIRVKLEREKRENISKVNDIIFPIIVPENMSECGNLMATILGMLGEVIEERDKEEQKKRKKYNADCIRKSHLQLKYDEVVKQYTYIQKEYRDILIHQYTTENDYVLRSAKVFSSDTEFINKFNELIDELVKTRNQEGNSGLLFLFIDDIDLSTYRCADIVKTLLSYLSNENIVTFISGGLETFEEALALDFLRQENVLDKDILDKKVGNDTLLASKKKLAYEYLKKIIPPAYRYNIKYWSLEEMGNYCIADLGENQEKEEQGDSHQEVGIRLSELLSKALKNWVVPAFFCCGDAGEDEKDNESPKGSADHDGNPQSAWKALPYTYHLFDNTSRGLNNIYNVLSEIAAERENQGKGNQEKDYSKEKKLLLDTIISSKPIYNKYRNEIQQNFFNVGMTKADSRVFFDNARAIIYKEEMMENNLDGSEKQKEYQGLYRIKKPVERFSLFILVDFAARLLYEGDYEKRVKNDEFYRALKEEAMKDLFFHPIIAEKIMDVPKYRWENKEAPKDGKKTELKLKDMELKDVNISFLLKGDLALNLAYYKNLPLSEMLKLYEDKGKNQEDKPAREAFPTAELEQDTVIAVWRAFSSIAKVNANGDVSQIVARYYSVFWKEFAYIRNQMSSSVTQNITIRLFDNEINEVLRAEREKVDFAVLGNQMGRILSNTLARMLKAKDADEIEDKLGEISSGRQYVILKSKEETEIGTEKAPREDVERRVQILEVIDSKKLWQAEAAEEVVLYLKRTVRRYLRVMKERMEEKVWKLNTSVANDSWEKFKKADKGVSSTVAKRTFNEVNNILKEMQTDFSSGMFLGTYREVIEKMKGLAGNNLVWYGQSEAQEIINKSMLTT